MIISQSSGLTKNQVSLVKNFHTEPIKIFSPFFVNRIFLHYYFLVIVVIYCNIGEKSSFIWNINIK